MIATAKQGSTTEPQIFTELDGQVLTKPPSIGSAWATKVRAMRKDPTIALARMLAVAPVLGSQWSFESKTEAPEGAVSLIENTFGTLRLHLLRNTFNGWLDFGWSPFEKVFGVDDASGSVTLKKMKPLLQDITDILVDPQTGTFAGLRQEKDRVTELAVEQCLLLSCDTEGTNWHGQALMKNAEIAYDAHLQIESAASKYDKRVAGSHWVVYYPLGQSLYNGQMTDNFEIAKDILSNLSASGRVAVPRVADQLLEEVMNVAGNVKDGGWRVELLTDSGTSRAAFIDRMKYLDALKVRALGLPERSVLEGEFGTKAEAEAHGDFAITQMELRHEMVVQEINWHAVDQVLDLNFGPQARGTVYIKPAPIADKTRAFIQSIYTKIIESPEGFAHELMAIDTGAIKDKLGIPVDEEGEDLTDSGLVAAPQPDQGFVTGDAFNALD